MAQKYQPLVQEDLNIGTGDAWITAPGGGELFSTQVGLHSVARGQRAYEATWAPGAIAAGSKTSTTLTVPDATTGDFVMASHSKVLTSELRISGHVSAADTVKVVIHNPTASSVTVASGTARVIVFPHHGISVDPPASFTVTWVVVESEAGAVGESWDYTFTPTIVGGTAPYTYNWDFGDGVPDTNEIPTQVWDRGAYSNPDTISVTLTVTDDTTATAVYTDSVVVLFNE
jgi:hypothetical protein